ncbi:hypothetical protein QZH41_016969 [Actinostola sp. cb2023]|nr:hypothetical protein QZH41_016969 [Actinostola sp. cb2023]
MVVDENDGNAMDRFIFFDIETMPLEAVHRVNLVVAMKVCTLCVGWTNHDGRCEQCEERQMVFSTIDAFCTWLFRPEHQNSIVFAHNFMGYDSYFLLEWLCVRGQRPEVVMRGAKCMYMYVKGLNLKFKDSLCFLPMALRKFSKTFNLPEEKGYFPHFFNCPENQDYVGPYPALEFYGVESMKEEDAEKLRLWHTDQLVCGGNLVKTPTYPSPNTWTIPNGLPKLMFGPKTEVRHLLLINENLAQLQYDKVDDFTRESGFASVVHAAFVTSFARLKLYRYLEELQERVLYFDTDSIFYVTHPGQALLPLGDYLGDLTSELKRPGDFIREFVSTGPKSYAYVTDQGDKEVKCKGIPLNVMSSAVINFKSMLRLVEGMEEKYVVTEPHRIQRDAKRRQLKTVEMSKDFRVVYDKRVRRRVDTVPYGYLDERENER